ncbi:MAG: glycosyltransferase family 4 protein, partial [Candidatus Promineifilaceae bacterium]
MEPGIAAVRGGEWGVSAPAVCILTETYFPVVGGGETQAKALAEGLAAAGHQITVLTRRSQPELRSSEQIGPAWVVRLPPGGRNHTHKWGLLLSAGPALLRLRDRYDVILVCGFRILGLPAVLVGRWLGKPVVLKADSPGEMSGEFFQAGLARVRIPAARPLLNLFVRGRNRVLRRADAFVAISSEIGRELAAQGVPSELIHAIPNGVDADRFRPIAPADKRCLRERLGLPQEVPLVIYVGRLVSYKGLPELLEAWPDVRRACPDAHLILVGSGGLDIHNCEAALRARVAAGKLAESVRFAGEVAEVESHLKAADIFVLP